MSSDWVSGGPKLNETRRVVWIVWLQGEIIMYMCFILSLIILKNLGFVNNFTKPCLIAQKVHYADPRIHHCCHGSDAIFSANDSIYIFLYKLHSTHVHIYSIYISIHTGKSRAIWSTYCIEFSLLKALEERGNSDLSLNGNINFD